MKFLWTILALCVVSQAAPNRRLRGPVGGPKGTVADRSSRIYQADGNADPGQFPYHAHIVANGAFMYGGTLISESYVLTSALAIYGHTTWDIKLGVTILSANEPGLQIRNSRTAKLPPDWLPPIREEDNIGLINLIVPVEITAYVKPALLPRHADASDTFEGRSTIATGFGQIGDSGATSDYLRYVRMAVLSTAECDRKLGIILSDRDLCAEGVGNTCAGDNGGGLVIEESPTEQYTVIGVIAFGASSCETVLTAGFSKVTSYLNWIETASGIPIIP